MKKTKLANLVLLITSLASWSGVLLILYLNITNNNFGRLDLNITNVLSYFTVQSNIFVGIVSTYLLIKGYKNPSFTTRLVTLSSVVNITITGIIYVLILEDLWQPVGLVGVANQLLHYITPILYVFFWLFIREKNAIPYKVIIGVLIYPLLYLIYSLVRGSLVGFYPYPFIDASQISFVQILINSLGLFVFFLIVAGMYVAINNFLVRRKA